MEQGRKKRNTFIQCQTCGKIYLTPYEIEIDKLYIIADCPHCGMATGLNLGDKEEDVYEFYNINVDPRFYNY